jgi:lysozyme family protein
MRWLLIIFMVLFAATSYSASIKPALVITFGNEGGLQCDRNDPGNWYSGKVGKGRQGCTKFGIATNSYPNVDIRNLTIQQAAKIYERDYWNPNRLGEFERQEIANEIFDTSVNCGVKTGGNMVIKLVNIFGPAHYPLNGGVNAEQVEWINQHTKKGSDYRMFLKALNVLQGQRYLNIMETNPRMLRYGTSWFSRVN